WRNPGRGRLAKRRQNLLDYQGFNPPDPPVGCDSIQEPYPLRSRLLLLGVCALAALLGPHHLARPDGSTPSASSFQKDLLPFLKQHCYACHGNGKKRGELSLDSYRDELSLQKDRKVWDSVIHMIRSGEMPPAERPRPAARDVEYALKAIDTVLAKLDCTG